MIFLLITSTPHASKMSWLLYVPATGAIYHENINPTADLTYLNINYAQVQYVALRKQQKRPGSKK